MGQNGDSPIIAQSGRMGQIRPGTRLAVREATPEEFAHEEARIRALYTNTEPEWLGCRWYVVWADDPTQVLFDWFSPVGGDTREMALCEARRYARARGAEVVDV